MAYVDHAFSISDEEMMMEGSHADNNGGPIKEIALAVALLVFGALGIVVGIFMAMNKVGGDRAHGLFFAILGGVLFIPGFTIRGLHTMLTRVIKVICLSSYFQRLYIAHRDIGLPQVWPRQHEEALNPPNARYKLVFFAGLFQNSLARRDLLELWKNDSSFDVFAGISSFSYKERIPEK